MCKAGKMRCFCNIIVQYLTWDLAHTEPARATERSSTLATEQPPTLFRTSPEVSDVSLALAIVPEHMASSLESLTLNRRRA